MPMSGSVESIMSSRKACWLERLEHRLHGARLQLREVEQVVDDAQEMLATCQEHARRPSLFRARSPPGSRSSRGRVPSITLSGLLARESCWPRTRTGSSEPLPLAVARVEGRELGQAAREQLLVVRHQRAHRDQAAEHSVLHDDEVVVDARALALEGEVHDLDWIGVGLYDRSFLGEEVDRPILEDGEAELVPNLAKAARGTGIPMRPFWSTASESSSGSARSVRPPS